MMKLLLSKLRFEKFEYPSSPVLIHYPEFRDFQSQFLQVRHAEPIHYLKIVAKDNRTKMFVFPSRFLIHRYLLMKVKDVKDKRPLLKKTVIYPLVKEKRYIYSTDKFMRKINADVIYAYVDGFTPFTLKEFIDLMNELGRERYAYMYTLSIEKIRELEKLKFEYIVLDAYKLSTLTALAASKILNDILTQYTGR